ncbi:hypothetical protein BJX68DRAFT_242596 [Aspergillus pseudodeflectus]|uniref:Uncharacterized protein n=1 Tax=Aspergillus pseudodeflectus TaxID=176178 RepID=A0ABR4K195_9EURO
MMQSNTPRNSRPHHTRPHHSLLRSHTQPPHTRPNSHSWPVPQYTRALVGTQALVRGIPAGSLVGRQVPARSTLADRLVPPGTLVGSPAGTRAPALGTALGRRVPARSTPVGILAGHIPVGDTPADIPGSSRPGTADTGPGLRPHPRHRPPHHLHQRRHRSLGTETDRSIEFDMHSLAPRLRRHRHRRHPHHPHHRRCLVGTGSDSGTHPHPHPRRRHSHHHHCHLRSRRPRRSLASIQQETEVPRLHLRLHPRR